MKHDNKWLLSPIALALLAMMSPASAQPTPEPAKPSAAQPLLIAQAPATEPAKPAAGTTAVEAVVITGFRASLESALNKKREDNGIVDVIKAEDIGKFPDTNLAESLQRVPGVVIDRDAGEGRTITVRGLAPLFTRVRINGVEALATTGGTDSSGGANRGRGFDFNVFASELFSSITVRKSTSADIDEGSLGATVDLATTRPFDLRGFNATASFQERYNDLSKKTDPRGAFLISNTFADGMFGALLSGAYSKRNLYEDGFSTVRWDNGPSSGGWCAPTGVTANPSTSTATTCGPAAQGVARIPGTAATIAAYNDASNVNNYTPRIPRYGRLIHEQERTGVTGSLQFKPTNKTLLTFDMLYSKLDATRSENFLEALSFSRTLAQGGKPQTSVLETQYSPSGQLLYGVYNGVDIRSESRYDVLSTTFTQPTLSLEHAFSDTLKLNAKLGRADSKFRNPIQTTTTLDALNVNGYSIDFRTSDRLPTIKYPFDVTGSALTLVGVPQVTTGTQATTVANTTTSEIRVRSLGNDNRNDLAHLDLAWDAIPDKLTIRGGGDYKKSLSDTYEFRRVNQSDTIFAPPAGTTVASLTTLLSGFGGGQSLPAGTPTSWVIPNLPAIAQAYNIYCNCIVSGPAGGPGDFRVTSITNGAARGNNQSVTEKTSGGFLMGDFTQDVWGRTLRGNIGARYVRTDVVATGYQATAGGTQVTVNNSYNDLLPSANFAYDVTRDFVLRLAAAKVMSRPQLTSLNPGGSVATTGALTITSGNPLLKPYRAKTLDASFEWYFAKNSLFGVGLFHKKIDSYIQTLAINQPYNQTGLPLSLLPASFTGSEVFTVTTPINTPGGNLSGIELNYQQPFTFLPGLGKNFGTTVNYTYVKSKINYVTSATSNVYVRDDLLQLSPQSVNATLYYDDGRFTARVSGTYRGAYLTAIPGGNNNDVAGKNSSVNVDMSISYKYTPKLEITLQGVNLTNAANDQFVSRARNSVVTYNVTGREYMLGLRYKF